MQVTVRLTKAELAEMAASESQIKDGMIQALDGGVEIAGDGKLYLAGFNVDVQVMD